MELVLGDCALPPGSSHTSLICGRPVLCHGNALGAIRRIGNLTRSLCYAGGADSAVALRHGRRADGPLLWTRLTLLPRVLPQLALAMASRRCSTHKMRRGKLCCCSVGCLANRCSVNDT